jgi:tetratricopeptide (TPR) repeat protein
MTGIGPGGDDRAYRVCPGCRAKFGAERSRCPRCRRRVDPAELAPSRRGPAPARAALALVGGFAAMIGMFWVPEAPEGAIIVERPADPLAARRAAAVDPPPAPSPPEADRTTVVSPPAAALPPPIAAAVVSEETLTRLEDAARRGPATPEAFGSLGQALVRAERATDAIGPLTRAIDLAPDRPELHLDLAAAHAMLGQWSDAEQEYRTALRLQPANPDVAFHLGRVLQQNGNLQGAIDAYRRAIDLDGAAARYHLALAVCYESLKDGAAALAAYREYVRLAPDGPEPRRIRTRIGQLGGA